MKIIKTYEEWSPKFNKTLQGASSINELKLYTNYGDYNTEDNIQKLKDMNIKFPTEEEFVDLVKSNFIDSGISLEDAIDYALVNKLTAKVNEEIVNKYGKDFTFSFNDHPYGYSKWLGKNTGSLFSLAYNPFCEKTSYQGCIYMYEFK